MDAPAKTETAETEENEQLTPETLLEKAGTLVHNYPKDELGEDGKPIPRWQKALREFTNVGDPHDQTMTLQIPDQGIDWEMFTDSQFFNRPPYCYRIVMHDVKTQTPAGEIKTDPAISRRPDGQTTIESGVVGQHVPDTEILRAMAKQVEAFDRFIKEDTQNHPRNRIAATLDRLRHHSVR